MFVGGIDLLITMLDFDSLFTNTPFAEMNVCTIFTIVKVDLHLNTYAF